MKKTDYSNSSKERQIKYLILNIFVSEKQNKELNILKEECGMCSCNSTISTYWPAGKKPKTFEQPKVEEKESKDDYNVRANKLYNEHHSHDLFVCNYSRCSKHFSRSKISDFIKKSKTILK